MILEALVQFDFMGEEDLCGQLIARIAQNPPHHQPEVI